MLQRLQGYDFHDVQDMGLPLEVGGSQAKGIVLHVAPDDEMSVRKYLLEQQIEATKMSLGDCSGASQTNDEGGLWVVGNSKLSGNNIGWLC